MGRSIDVEARERIGNPLPTRILLDMAYVWLIVVKMPLFTILQILKCFTTIARHDIILLFDPLRLVSPIYPSSGFATHRIHLRLELSVGGICMPRLVCGWATDTLTLIKSSDEPVRIWPSIMDIICAVVSKIQLVWCN
jgi:hypothetical protein